MAFFKKFFLPKMTSSLVIRATIVALFSVVFFYYFVTPIRLNGKSMEPTLKDKSIHFISPVYYFFREIKKGDIVAIKLSGRSVLLLKRVVALEGESVKFEKGKLFVNGIEVKEDYATRECDWEYSERVVQNGKVFVVGDNRSVPMESHQFGEVSKKRILGKLIW